MKYNLENMDSKDTDMQPPKGTIKIFTFNVFQPKEDTHPCESEIFDQEQFEQVMEDCDFVYPHKLEQARRIIPLDCIKPFPPASCVGHSIGDRKGLISMLSNYEHYLTDVEGDCCVYPKEPIIYVAHELVSTYVPWMSSNWKGVLSSFRELRVLPSTLYRHLVFASRNLRNVDDHPVALGPGFQALLVDCISRIPGINVKAVITVSQKKHCWLHYVMHFAALMILESLRIGCACHPCYLYFGTQWSVGDFLTMEAAWQKREVKDQINLNVNNKRKNMTSSPERCSVSKLTRISGGGRVVNKTTNNVPLLSI